jgi:hypothetical protein
MGTNDEPWTLDNERPAPVLDVPGFWLDTVPVSNRAYQELMAAGRYEDPSWWTEADWTHRVQAGLHARPFWQRADDPDAVEGGRLRRRSGVLEPVPLDEPVLHVCWYEADAYARWAGRRLPTGAVPTPVFSRQRQIDRRGHRTVLAEHRVRELEQGVTAPGQARVEVLPKAGREVESIPSGIVVQHTHLCGLRMNVIPWRNACSCGGRPPVRRMPR